MSLETNQETRERDLRIKAVDKAIELFVSKTFTNVKDMNIQLEQCYKQIYQFYNGNIKELH